MPEVTSKITETDYSMTSTERIGYLNGNKIGSLS